MFQPLTTLAKIRCVELGDFEAARPLVHGIGDFSRLQLNRLVLAQAAYDD